MKDPFVMQLEHCPDVLEVDEFCNIMRIGKNSAYKILDSGAIKAFRVGTSWKIPKNSVIEFLQNPTHLIQ